MKPSLSKKALSWLMALVMVFSVFGTALAADLTGTSVITVSPQAPQEVELVAGQLYQLDLKDVFRASGGETLEYSFSGGDFGEQTRITKDDLFAFCVAQPGTYRPTLTASCPGASASHTITIQVKPASEGLPEQYHYDETPAQSVTVWVTVGSDGVPLMGNDENATVLAHTQVTVPYFDLDLYGLSDFYRYETDGGRGPYINDHLVQRPTMLHLYIILLEHYYIGYPWEDCGKGITDVMDFGDPMDVCNMNGDLAYTGEMKALNITGSPTSLYCQQFWGHDENLMYYRNHVYPLMSPGWGATADYILLSDDDTIDIGMYSDWSFWNDGGAFTRFDQDSYECLPGQELTVRTTKYETVSVSDGGSENFLPVTNLEVGLYDAHLSPLHQVSLKHDGNGVYHLTLPETPGTYLLLGLDPNAGTPDARLSCASAQIHVQPAPSQPLLGDLNGDGSITSPDANLVYGIVNGKIASTPDRLTAGDVDGDGRLTARDANLIYGWVNGRITSFPGASPKK